MTERVLGPAGSKRRSRFRFLPLPLVLVVALALFLAGGAQAVHDQTFQLDGNTTVDAATNLGTHTQNFDWESFFNSSGAASPTLPDPSRPGYTASAFQRDFRTNPGCSLTGTGTYCTADSSTFTTGSKDTLNITPGWQCTYSNNVNSKTDLSNVYAVFYTDNQVGSPTFHHQFIYFGLERNDNSGDGNIAFWFLQDNVGCNAATSGVNVPFTGVHKDGDVLVVSSFTNGGAVSNVTAYRWNGSSPGSLGTTPIANGGDCTATSPPAPLQDASCATVNKGTISVPWLTANKNDGAQHNLRIAEFFEGGLDLTNSGITGKCFSSFLGDTRSSQSLTATIFDYAGGTFEHCGANISITPSAVNEVGTAHTFTINVTQSNAGVSSPAPDGTKPVVTVKDQNNNTITPTSNNCSSPGTVNGICTVTVNSSSAAVLTAHATASVVLDGTTVNVATDGSTGNSGDAVKRYVDANVSITPSAVNEVGHAHTFTISTTAIPSGTTPTLQSITPSVSPAPGTQSTTCNAPTVNGNTATCTVTINSNSVGTFTANATAVWNFHDNDAGANPANATVTRTTDGTHGSSGSATKKFVDANVQISPSAVNEVGHAHTFTITVNALPGTASPVAFTSITPSVSPAPDSQSNTCTNPTVNGNTATCTLTINSSTVGTFTANATAVVTMGGTAVTRTSDGTHGSSGSATKKFVDANISIAPNGVNEVGHAHTFTITVNALPGSVTPVAFTSITPSVTGSPGSKSDTCSTPVVSGNTATCTLTINNPTAGTFTASASAVVTMGGTAVSRSTDGTHGSSNPVVKRFVDANVSVTPNSATNEVNHQHVFTITSVASPSGTTPTIDYIHFTLSSVPSSESDSCGTPSQVGNTASCTVTINSSSAGTFTLNAEAKWTFADGDPGANPASVDVVRSTQGNSGPGGSGPATKRFVDAYITIGPAEATNSVGQAHTDTVNVFVDNGNHAPGIPVWAPAPDGTIVHVTLTPDPSDPGAVPVIIPPGDLCGTVGTSGGACTITFTSATAGSIIAHASVDVAVGGLTLHRETDGNAPNSGNAIKHFRAGAIAWSKQDDAGRPLGGATFNLCQISTYNVGTGNFDPLPAPGNCQSVTDNQPPDEDGAPGGFKVSGLQLGQYTVHETQAPPGYVLDQSTKEADLTPANSGSVQVIQQPFVNRRPVVKITGFGYTNAPEPAGVPQPDGIFKGVTTYTVKLHNYGTAAADLSNSSLVVSGDVTCDGGNSLPITGSIPAGGDLPDVTLTCHYDHPAAPGQISAQLVVKYTTNMLERTASGSPAVITFTVAPN